MLRGRLASVCPINLVYVGLTELLDEERVAAVEQDTQQPIHGIRVTRGHVHLPFSVGWGMDASHMLLDPLEEVGCSERLAVLQIDGEVGCERLAFAYRSVLLQREEVSWSGA